MALMADLITQVRRELGDKAVPFERQIVGDDIALEFELGVGLIQSGVNVRVLIDSQLSVLIEDTDFTLDYDNGILTLLGDPLPQGSTLVIDGTATSLFTDAELEDYVNNAALQHTYGRDQVERYRDEHGFIKYDYASDTIDNLPEIEVYLVGILATIECLWTLSTDAATDVDIQTAEGTFVARGQRYRQVLQQIDLLTAKYQTLCEQLNVGLYRIEVSQLRRVSRTNNRLVPVYKPREYDDNAPPQRLLPPIDHRDDDESGIASPANGGWW